MGTASNNISLVWSRELAYTIGLIATDGNLSPDKRHINITSKDEDILLAIRNSLGLTCKIGKKARGASLEKKYSVLNIGSKNFYNFLLSIGLRPNKSKTMGELQVPRKFFGDFLRGCIDGDGSITSSTHPETKLKQLRVRLVSASTSFLDWIKVEINRQLKLCGGWVYTSPNKTIHTLSYGKQDSIKILKFIYKRKGNLYLKRKFIIAKMFMGK